MRPQPPRKDLRFISLATSFPCSPKFPDLSTSGRKSAVSLVRRPKRNFLESSPIYPAGSSACRSAKVWEKVSQTGVQNLSRVSGFWPSRHGSLAGGTGPGLARGEAVRSGLLLCDRRDQGCRFGSCGFPREFHLPAGWRHLPPGIAAGQPDLGEEVFGAVPIEHEFGLLHQTR